jgi:hypothetical protein
MGQSTVRPGIELMNIAPAPKPIVHDMAFAVNAYMTIAIGKT